MMLINNQERKYLRNLAKNVAEIADLPVMEERRETWFAHNDLYSKYPMMLIFPEGSWQELIPPETFKCENEGARFIEMVLKRRIYGFEHFLDDTVVEKEWVVHKSLHDTGWGIESRRIPSSQIRGAWHFDPVIKEPSDLKKLKFPQITHDEKRSLQNLEEMQDLFGDILHVKLEGIKTYSFHLMSLYTSLRGLEEVMYDMLDQPQMLHDAMAFLTEGHERILKQFIDQNLLSLNNDNSYQNSGGNSYTHELPKAGFKPESIRLCDMWASAESQEMAQVSPAHHYEFAMAYEKRLLAPFGLTGYGCCEDLTRKLDDVFTIPHIRRISISPFADVDRCAEKLKGNYIYSWKPNPAHLVGQFDEQTIREYVRHTLEVAKTHQCVLEIILKDTHTCEFHPERFDRWTRIVREEINECFGDNPEKDFAGTKASLLSLR